MSLVGFGELLECAENKMRERGCPELQIEQYRIESINAALAMNPFCSRKAKRMLEKAIVRLVEIANGTKKQDSKSGLYD